MIAVGRIRGDLKVHANYMCSRCGAQRWRIVRVSVDFGSPEALVAEIGQLSELRVGFPVGWAHYGSGLYKCEECKS